MNVVLVEPEIPPNTGNVAGFAPVARGMSDGFTLYVVDGTQAVVIETDDQQLMLGRLEKVQ